MIAKRHKLKLSDVKQIKITGDYIRLDALLKYAAIASTGGEAKIQIQDGNVFVGGERCTQRGKKIHPGDVVRYGNGSSAVWLVVVNGQINND